MQAMTRARSCLLPDTRIWTPRHWLKEMAQSHQASLPGSDLEPHANDRLGDHAQAGVVVAGVPAHELVGVIDRDRFPVRGDPLACSITTRESSACCSCWLSCSWSCSLAALST